MNGRRQCYIIFALLLWLWWPIHVASKEAVPASIAQMNHRTWMVMNGAPADIWSMLQDSDGFIWLGTGSGLYRFDGMQFEHYVPPPGEQFLSNDITAIKKLPNGELWIGASNGSISLLKNGHVTNFPMGHSAPWGPVYCFGVTQDGAVWAVADHRLLRYTQGHWEKIGEAWNYPDAQAMWMVVDAAGTAWLATNKELLFLRKDAHRFEHTGIAIGTEAVLALSPDGTLWVSDGLHGTRALPGLSPDHIPTALTAPLPTTDFARSKRLLFDRNGALWGTLWPSKGVDGIYRIADPSRFADGQPLRPEQVADIYNTTQGLTSIVAVPLLEDQEGNIWVGTNFGLNSFHGNSFTRVSPAKGDSPTDTLLAGGNEGAVWILQGDCLYRMHHTIPEEVVCDLPKQASALYVHTQTAWMVMSGMLYRWTEGDGASVTPVPTPNNESSAHITAMASDRDGHLWIGLDSGLYEQVNDTWQHINTGDQQNNEPPSSIAPDKNGNIWVGYTNNVLVRWDGKQPRSFTAEDGLDVGNILTITAQGESLLIGGETGLAQWNNGRFQSINLADSSVLSAISGVVLTRSGDVWLNTSVGIIQIGADEIQYAFRDTNYVFRYKLFDCDDGVPGIALRATLVSTAAADEDGKLWFDTNQGVGWIDPAHVHLNNVAPHVLIRAVIAGGKRYEPGDGLVLPSQTNTVTLQYTAASFVAPQRIKFRYKLSGVDTNWQDGGTQREAVYTNLQPGDYQFQVIAANSDGLWNEQGSSIRFSIKRTFYQTRYFVMICIFLAIMLVIGLVLLQFRQMEAKLRDRLEVRHAERERIARELHDTLLQGIQGLILRFHAIAERIPPQEPLRVMIDQALDRADGVLVDGRDRVRDLRVSEGATKDLAVTFAALGKELSVDHPVMFRVVSSGTRQDIDPPIREEIHLIGREALLNAFQHAKAQEIEVEICYDFKQLRVCVRDNGVGIDPQILNAGHKPGHWGLVGMRERATCIGGQLAIWARPGSGTEVELTVPASIAYARKHRAPWKWLRQVLSLGR